MYKNVSGQKISLFAFDTATGAAKTGDAANLTFYVTKDDGSVTALGDTSASELSNTNAKGWYTCDLTQAETNATKLLFTGKSSTSGVEVVGQLIYTVDPRWFGIIQMGTLAGVTSTSVFDLASTAINNDDAYNGCFWMPAGDGTGPNQNGSTIVDYDGTNKRVTLSPALDQSVSTDTTYYVFANASAVAEAYAGTVRALDASGNALATASDIATLLSRLTSTRAGYLDNLSVAIASASDMATVLSRLSAARAGYLDNLSGGAVALNSDIATLLTRLSSARAGYLDNLSGGAAALQSTAAAILADTGTDGVVLSAAQMNKIADHVLRRTNTNVEGSSDGDSLGFRSLYGAVAKLTNKIAISSNTLSIKKVDDSTNLGTQTLTTDAGQAPVVSADTD